MNDPGRAPPPGFVLQLELKRIELGLSHEAWATYLGIKRNQWYRLRAGRRLPSQRLVGRVLLEWPEAFEPLVRGVVDAHVRRREAGQEVTR